jgi:hypothetical protein
MLRSTDSTIFFFGKIHVHLSLEQREYLVSFPFSFLTHSTGEKSRFFILVSRGTFSLGRQGTRL